MAGSQGGYGNQGSRNQPEPDDRRSQVGYGLSQRPEPQSEASQARMTPQQQYAADLKAQIDAKKALSGAGRQATSRAERADDDRVQRESAQLRAEHDGEISKQRQREAQVEQNSQRHVEYMAREQRPQSGQGQQRGGGYQESRGGGSESPWPEANNDGRHRNDMPGRAEQQGAPHISANRYASGANQNSGNVMTDRSTTRIHHAPGGKSSIVLG